MMVGVNEEGISTMRMRECAVKLLCAIVICGFAAPITAAAASSIVHASTPSQDWVKEHLGDDFVGDVKLGLHTEGRTVALYLTKDFVARLSLWRDGKEHKLWSLSPGFEIFGLFKRPVLFFRFGRSARPDLVLCYGVNLGTGGHSERWDQSLVVFPECRKDRRFEIPFASVDIFFSEDDEGARYFANGGRDKKAHDRRSIAILTFPSTGLMRIMVWSRERIFSTDEERDHQPREELVSYYVHESGHVSKNVHPAWKIKDHVFHVLQNRETIVVR